MKSTLATTPVTWKRAKLPGAPELIEASRLDGSGLQRLGDAIIGFCNLHARESIDRYDLDAIGYARLIVDRRSNAATYSERMLCSRENPAVFRPEQFYWRWSEPKRTVKKEQLQALHGFHGETGRKWFAWHGLGENQLHFTGEPFWLPVPGEHSVSFDVDPAKRMPFRDFLGMMERLSG